MGVRSKALITLGLVVVVVAAVVLQTQTDLFRGELRLDRDLETDVDVEEEADVLLPNLRASLDVIVPEDDGDLILDVLIENLGPGYVSGDNPYTYALFVEEVEVFRAEDSFTRIEAGDSISFQYPVSRRIFEYPDSGTASLVVDVYDVIAEVDKTNNTAEAEYSY